MDPWGIPDLIIDDLKTLRHYQQLVDDCPYTKSQTPVIFWLDNQF